MRREAAVSVARVEREPRWAREPTEPSRPSRAGRSTGPDRPGEADRAQVARTGPGAGQPDRAGREPTGPGAGRPDRAGREPSSSYARPAPPPFRLEAVRQSSAECQIGSAGLPPASVERAFLGRFLQFHRGRGSPLFGRSGGPNLRAFPKKMDVGEARYWAAVRVEHCHQIASFIGSGRPPTGPRRLVLWQSAPGYLSKP